MTSIQRNLFLIVLLLSSKKGVKESVRKGLRELDQFFAGFETRIKRRRKELYDDCVKL